MRVYTIFSNLPLFPNPIIDQVDNNTFKYGLIVQADEVDDGYHTMSELYEHRYALFAALIKIYDGYITPLGPTPVRAWKSKLHDDGTMFDDSFICGLTRRNISEPDLQISYHLPLSWWNKVNCLILPSAPKWDGYTSNDVIERLLKL